MIEFAPDSRQAKIRQWWQVSRNRHGVRDSKISAAVKQRSTLTRFVASLFPAQIGPISEVIQATSAQRFALAFYTPLDAIIS
jgi:hypothetical protein